MANQEHIDLLRQGTTVWNAWRREHSLTFPNLSYANLSGVNLYGVNLTFVDLTSANLTFADLGFADLTSANLTFADLGFADLHSANLGSANLTFANLGSANLTSANLSGTNFDGTIVGQTVFGDLDLRTAKGLQTLRHARPSTIGTDTLERSQGDIPEVFLRGAGLSDTFIEYVRSLVAHPIEYYTCFLSYSSKDQDIAERLYADLQSKGVRCWYAPDELKPGDYYRAKIDESIRVYDKLVLILSENSVESEWVEKEVSTALKREESLDMTRQVLFPLRLDDAVLQSRRAWVRSLRYHRHIGDFTQWKNHIHYQQAFAHLMRDLIAGESNG